MVAGLVGHIVNGVDMDSNCVHTSDISRQGLSESKAERMNMFSQPRDLIEWSILDLPLMRSRFLCYGQTLKTFSQEFT